ncbi:FGGY family carbohydrate kinase [Actinocatenispora comari]|uniref:Carbohydrate kinase FGGY N-terminal domain-containing protein n=1 Tax=Actinocatenispora comari TaxID=2807577 RepID=A0A8J4AEE4_9ACTN|nr:FGGY family carbohydrate kinase [Actinocatenispora comari]GIL28167.1 hypothetical protein NUM_34210 [Actinocatenispora comari]
MSAPLVCAVDVGSTRIKAALRAAGEPATAAGTAPYPAGAAHDAVWHAVTATIRELMRHGRPDALILGAQMGGLCLLDRRYEPIGALEPGIDLDPDAAHRLDLTRSGCEQDRPTAAHRLAALLSADPTLRPAVTLVGGVKEYLLRRLTGAWVSDPASASASGFYDLATGTWSAETCAAVGIDPAGLPAIEDPGTIVGSLTAAAARACALPAGTPVWCGIGDGPAANLSAAATDWHGACLSQGTTTVARVLGRRARPPAVGPDCFTQHVSTGWWAVGARVVTTAVPDPARQVLERIGRRMPIERVLVTGGSASQVDDPRARPVTADRADGTRGLALIAAGAALRTDQPVPTAEGWQ